MAGLAEALLDLQELTRRLRRDCPWDREQTARTIVPHTVEEAYEVADAAIAGDDAKLVDELGDLLFQVYFLALLLEERGGGDLEQAARLIHQKLVRRHPHVFGEVEAETAGRVRANWEQIKRDQEGREGIFHDVPESLPSLLFARKVQRRTAAIAFEYPDVAGAQADLDDELRELKEAIVEAGGEPAPEVEANPRSSRSSVTCCSRPSTSRAALTSIPSSRCARRRSASAAASSAPSGSRSRTATPSPSSRSRSRIDTSTRPRRVSDPPRYIS